MDFLRYVGLLSLLLIFFPKQSSADLFKATQHYQHQEFNLAHKEFLELSKFGNADAMYNLAVMSLHGQGTNKSLPSAYAWFLLAHQFGILDAKQTAELIKQQYSDKQALEDVYQALLGQYAFNTISKRFYPSEFSKSKQQITKIRDHHPSYPEQAIRQGVEGWVWIEYDIDDSGAVTDISLIDSHPKHIFSTELINAVSLWKYETSKPIKNRSLTYHFTTFKGEQYKTAFHTQRRQYQKALGEHIDAAEKGNGEIQYYISQWLQSENYNASKLLKYHWQDEQAAQALLLAAAKNNFTLAQYKLATSILTHDFEDPDRQVAINWLKVSASKDNPSSLYRLGSLLSNSASPDFAPNKAMAYFKAAADQGHFRALRDMCVLLKTIPNKEYETRQCISRGLKLDNSHPTLLFLKAQIESDKTLAEKFAQKALKAAQNRQWSTQLIMKFIESL